MQERVTQVTGVEISGSNLRFEFRGKSGKMHEVSISDRRLARIMQRCQALPGEDLFQWCVFSVTSLPQTFHLRMVSHPRCVGVSPLWRPPSR